MSCLAVLLLLGATSSGARAAVMHVPAQWSQISDALLNASPYDTILVAPGVYQENIVWPKSNGLKLLSTAGADSTIIDGGGLDQVIGVYTGVDTTTIIRGFTIYNGIAGGV